MRKNTIYLVGQISPKFKETYDWRSFVVKEFGNSKEIEVIDPCENTFNQMLYEKEEYAIQEDGRVFGVDVLPSKDLTYVLNSDIAIVNLNQYDKNKELLGSYYELAWMYLYQEKTVIAFADDLNSYNCRHPFVKMTVDVWCKDVKESCEIVRTYFMKPRPRASIMV